MNLWQQHHAADEQGAELNVINRTPPASDGTKPAVYESLAAMNL
jgi:hypothetical protein